jgi:UDPglucose 6-dehydrogenase
MQREFDIILVGGGVVGEATGLGFADRGHRVAFVDKNPERVAYFQGLGHDAFVPDEAYALRAPLLFVCIDTPQDDDGSVNLINIKRGMHTVGQIVANQQERMVVVVRSTVPPKTIRSQFVPIIEEVSGRPVGKAWGIAHNPEYLRAVSSREDFANPWATVLGIVEGDEETREALTRLYEPFGGERFFLSVEEAEMAKYINNLRNALVISFSNEMWMLGKNLGIDANKAMAVSTKTAESAWNPEYGSVGGFPYGGTCLPKDTTAMLSFAESNDIDMPLLREIVRVNNTILEWAASGKAGSAQIGGLKWKKSPKISRDN